MRPRHLFLLMLALLAAAFLLGFTVPLIHGLLLQHGSDGFLWLLLGVPVALCGHFLHVRSQMTAHLLFGDWTFRASRDELHERLGPPDCSSYGREDAWYLGFVSSPLDADCLHVWYTSDRVSKTKIWQH